MPGLGEVLVAAPAASAAGDQHAVAGGGQVGEGLSGRVVVGQRAHRNLQNQILAGMAGAVGTFAVAAAIGPEFAVVPVTEQGVVVRIGFEVDAAAVAAIAARRSAAGDVLFAAEGHAAVP